MLFVELRFFIFFLVVFGVYWLLNRNDMRKYWLLGASYVFYGAWDWRFLSLILISTLVDYIAGYRIAASASIKQKRGWLAVSLATNLGILGFFKYFNFFVESAVDLFGWLGIGTSFNTLEIILPVGISFYTFQTLSYSIDIYHGKLTPTRKLSDFSLYVAFFPQLVAGPIVRARDFLPQLNQTHRLRDIQIRAYLVLFLVGFFKKACVSDNLAPFVDAYFSAPEQYDAISAWFAVVFYAIQIYCDFSGYSDMAIATAGLLGYQLCINFNAPYFSRSITEFWRRWHISLSTWLRDYLYIPLGGNRGGALFTYRNLLMTMGLGGLWHGASWNFILWGLMHGGALVLHREWSRMKQRAGWNLSHGILTDLIAILLTFCWVCITWVFFRASDYASAMTILNAFVLGESRGSGSLSISTFYAIMLVALLGVAHLLTYRKVLDGWYSKLSIGQFASMYGVMASVAVQLVPVGNRPFIYFQF